MENSSSKRPHWIKVLGSKYFIATMLFLAWFIFFDENSLMTHRENKKRLEELIRQKEYYIERIASDRQKLKELNAGREQLEKFAREEYFMSNPQEDVFVIVEED